mgnify:CR=1 FL=1
MQSRSIRLDPLKGEYSVSVSLYRRYRPRSFDEVAGQETVVEVLKKALQRDQVAHAWLFSGPRGCGRAVIVTSIPSAGGHASYCSRGASSRQ